MDTRRFGGKVALVTGGASGIGRTCVQAFALDGASVVVADTNILPGHEIVAEIRDSGGTALFLRVDVSDPAAVERMIADTVMAFGRLDHAVNTAGLDHDSSTTADETLEGWRRVIDVSLNGLYHCVRHQVRQMVTQGGGSIVNVASISAAAGPASASARAAADLGALSLGLVTAHEYAASGIRVNTIGPLPGGMAAPLEAASSGRPTFPFAVGRPVARDQVASLAVYLCSDEASLITGAWYPIDRALAAR